MGKKKGLKEKEETKLALETWLWNNNQARQAQVVRGEIDEKSQRTAHMRNTRSGGIEVLMKRKMNDKRESEL